MTIDNQKKLAVAFIALMVALIFTIANNVIFGIGIDSIKLWIGTLIIFFPIYFFYTGSLSVKIITTFVSILAILTYLLFILGLSMGLGIVVSAIIIVLIFSFFLIS